MDTPDVNEAKDPAEHPRHSLRHDSAALTRAQEYAHNLANLARNGYVDPESGDTIYEPNPTEAARVDNEAEVLGSWAAFEIELAKTAKPEDGGDTPNAADDE